MTDNDIIKAFEAFLKTQEDGYITALEYGGKRDEAHEKYLCIFNGICDLINRKKAEASELQHRNSELDIELKAMRGAANSYKAEIERLRALNAKVSATSYHGEVISETYTFTVEVETDDIIGAKEQIAAALENIGKVAFPQVERSGAE